MDVARAVLVCIHEYLRKKEEESDFTDDFCAKFNESFYPKRTKAVRTEGYIERVVPKYNFGELHSHFDWPKPTKN